MQCNFNITKFAPKNSCCLSIETGKLQFDKWDLQSNFNITESKLYKLREAGNFKTKCVLLLYKILEVLREKHSKIIVENHKEITNFIMNSNLKYDEFCVKHSDVLLLKNNVEFVRQYLLNLNSSITITELLGTDQPFPNIKEKKYDGNRAFI